MSHHRVLGIQSRPSATAASSFNHSAVSPAPKLQHFEEARECGQEILHDYNPQAAENTKCGASLCPHCWAPEEEPCLA